MWHVKMSGGLDSMFKNKVCLWSPALGGLFRPTAWTPTHDPPADTPVEEGAKTLDWAESQIRSSTASKMTPKMTPSASLLLLQLGFGQAQPLQEEGDHIQKRHDVWNFSWRRVFNSLVAISFAVSTEFSSWQKIECAMQVYRSSTCICFISGQNEYDCFSVKNKAGCFSSLGRQTGLLLPPSSSTRSSTLWASSMNGPGATTTTASWSTGRTSTRRWPTTSASSPPTIWTTPPSCTMERTAFSIKHGKDSHHPRPQRPDSASRRTKAQTLFFLSKVYATLIKFRYKNQEVRIKKRHLVSNRMRTPISWVKVMCVPPLKPDLHLS